jgi:hypothetical protein
MDSLYNLPAAIPTEDALHQFRVLINDDHPSGNGPGTYVCCMMWGELEWVNMSSVSASKWMGMRNSISQGIVQQRMACIEIEENYKYQTRKLALALYEHLDNNGKEKLLSNYPDAWLSSAAVCHSCLDICNDKKKCKNERCGGMCDSCLEKLNNETGEVVCGACGEDQKQAETCPICQEEKDCDKMMFASGGCGHGICKDCFCSSYETSHPISTCPLCRGTFIGVRVETGPSVYEGDMFSARLQEDVISLLGEV